MASSKRDDTSPSESSPPEPPEAADAGEQLQSASNGPDREERIRQAAYGLSERRGFEAGRDVDDWLEAERQVDQTGSDERA